MSTTIIPLSEGVFTIGHDKIFVPFDTLNDELNTKPLGSLLVEIQPFLVQTNNKNILFDTGLGYSLSNGEIQIHHNLGMHGIEPNDIDMVILSHLHKDHAGGICSTNSLGIKQFNFPNAIYYIGRKEFEYAMEKASVALHGGPRSYVIEDIDILKNSPQVEWLDEKGVIQDFISYQTDGGHCPYHTSFLVNGEQAIFYAGDVAPQLKQLKTKYIAKYDFDGRRSMELRQEYAQKGREYGWTFLFYHDVNLPYATI